MSEVRPEIVELMSSCSDFNLVEPDDFEFISKQGSVPQCKDSME